MIYAKATTKVDMQFLSTILYAEICCQFKTHAKGQLILFSCFIPVRLTGYGDNVWTLWLHYTSDLPAVCVTIVRVRAVSQAQSHSASKCIDRPSHAKDYTERFCKWYFYLHQGQC